MKKGRGSSERGFTLPELMIVVVLMGILAAIAIPSFFGVVESRRVESAANQVVADFRNTNSTASNSLSTWVVVLVPNRTEESEGPDYYVTKLTSSGAVDTSISPTPRYLPDNVKVSSEPSLNDPASLTALYSLAAGFVHPFSTSRSVKFLPDGSVQVNGDTVEVIGSGSSRGKVTLVVTTGKVGAEVVS